MDAFRKQFIKELNPHSKVKKVIAVMSGKGGVGKSFVTTSLAVAMQRAGYRCAILDADITGPSIPASFGLNNQTYKTDKGIHPTRTKTGIQVMSLNLLVENPSDPVLWRGSLIADMVTQFWTDVYWEDVDYMFIDMPPGTGDVPLTIFQSLPVDGIVVVTSPQDLVTMIVEKAVKMAENMDIPILGIVENMSYFICPDCHKKHYIFGQSHLEEICKQYHIDHHISLPLDPKNAQYIDKGKAELMSINMDEILSSILQID